MTVIFLEQTLLKRKERRDRAQIRAKELVTFLTEKCEPNDAIPENMEPAALQDSIASIFYELETYREEMLACSLPRT